MADSANPQFDRAIAGSATPALPQTPKLPDKLRKIDPEGCDRFDAELFEYFKKLVVAGRLR